MEEGFEKANFPVSQALDQYLLAVSEDVHSNAAEAERGTIVLQCILNLVSKNTKMSLSSAVQVIIFLQLFSSAFCQFPMSFQMPQMTGMGGAPQMPMGPHSMASMAPIPPIAPQAMYPPPMANMPIGYPMQRKMPSVVMPYYSKSSSRPEKGYRRKRRKHHKYEDSFENDDSESGSRERDFRRSRSKKRRQVLTPVVSYVTKDGYVVYQKKIKKDKAKEWLELSKKKESKEMFSSAEERQFQKMLKYKKKKRHHH